MKLYYSVVFSTLVHFIFYLFADEVASHIEAMNLEKKKFEVVFVDDEDLRLIKDLNTPPADSYLPSNTNLLSAETRQFENQQKAAHLGENVNRSSEKSDEAFIQQEYDQKLDVIDQLSQDVIKKIKKENAKQAKNAKSDYNPNMFEPDNAPSTVYAPDTNAPIGTYTVLNTNRFTYYTFYERVGNQVKYHWTSTANRVTQRRPHIRRMDRDKVAWTTEVEVLLSPEGHFARADIHRSSGISQLDYAIIDAFRMGAPYLNPPAEMVDEDGFIRMNWSMTYFWKPNYYN